MKYLTKFEYTIPHYRRVLQSYLRIPRTNASTYIKRGDELTVKISNGYIRGKYLETENGRRFKSFTGIPYAKPPIGKLRFEAAIPADAWTGVKDATEENFEYLQYQPITSRILGKENLVINVFIPETITDQPTPMPVLVFIAGGIFKFGSASYLDSGPDFFFDAADIIFVTIQTRLGIFGSLCLDIPEAPGNMHCKDQVLALKWIQTNISVFSGDPSNVTLFGLSSGAMHAHLHMLSPMSQGLIHKVILHSGCAVNHVAINEDPKKYAFELGDILGYRTRNEYELFRFFGTVSSFDLVIAGHELSNVRRDEYHEFSAPFAPVVEKIFNNKECFISKHPLDILKSGNFSKIPMLISYTTEEGRVAVSFMRQKFCNLLQSFKLFETIPYEIKGSREVEMRKKIVELYGDGNQEWNHTLNNLVNYIGDELFNGGILLSAKLHGGHNNVYLSRFEYKGALNFVQNLLNMHTNGAIHGDQDGYVLKKYNTCTDVQEEDYRIRDMMVQMYLQFIKFGNPTTELTPLVNVKWEPVTNTKLNCLRIDDKLVMDDVDNFMGSRRKLWEELISHPLLPKV